MTFDEAWEEAGKQDEPGGLGWEFRQCMKLYSDYLKALKPPKREHEK